MSHHPRRPNGGVPRRHPGVERYLEKRSGDSQARLADAITAFAGSMPFVYVHVLGFAAWMMFAEAEPWATLTLVVSLEAIFLSTFVMIGQNRQAACARRGRTSAPRPRADLRACARAVGDIAK
jgi:uncharacterized membrane protein